jgi:hypothetical protein
MELSGDSVAGLFDALSAIASGSGALSALSGGSQDWSRRDHNDKPASLSHGEAQIQLSSVFPRMVAFGRFEGRHSEGKGAVHKLKKTPYADLKIGHEGTWVAAAEREGKKLELRVGIRRHKEMVFTVTMIGSSQVEQPLLWMRAKRAFEVVEGGGWRFPGSREE